MKRIVSHIVLAGIAVAALTFSAAAQTELFAPVFPSWTALVSPELAKAKGIPEPASELKACFDAHGAALLKKPERVWPLVQDHLGDDAMRRECAMAAEVYELSRTWRTSSPINSYGPFISFMSNQNKSLAAKSDLEKCQGRQFLFEAASTFNGMVGGMVPQFTFAWAKPAANAPCVTGQ